MNQLDSDHDSIQLSTRGKDMSRIEKVTEYPDEGFAILEDDLGKFIAFRDSLDLVSISEIDGYEPHMYSPKQSRQMNSAVQ